MGVISSSLFGFTIYLHFQNGGMETTHTALSRFLMTKQQPGTQKEGCELRARSCLPPTAPLGRPQPGQEASEHLQTRVEGRTR